jgi:catechol 2,3-dioxygenase-like lactoylglutathione lyase family enzyme
MRVMPIRYSRDVEVAVRFYRALGLRFDAASRPGSWAELVAPSGSLGIHHASGDSAGTCELAFVAEEPLEEVVTRLRAAGFEPDAMADESFGRSVRVADPDGTWVQVNEHDRTLYT